ncbi:U3 snoRNP protein [Pelomyxa schiedti]|nr:U3 snoRNP protein [Pelomyxa schiedti]
MSIREAIDRQREHVRTPKLYGAVSLLFDTQEAEKMPLSTVHKLGKTGLEDLIAKDQHFAVFEETLFTDAGIGFERQMHTEKENAKLGREISKLLTLLSPHFMDSSATQVLEYLLRNYSSHIYDVDALMKCALPYHETVTFAKLLQVLQLPPKWIFLSPCARKRSPVSRHLLVKECTGTTALLRFVCDAVMESIQAEITNKALLSLYYALFFEAVQSSPSIAQDVTKPLLVGLASSDMQFHTVSLMILSVLVSSWKLSTAMLDAVLEAIFIGYFPEKCEGVCMCLANLCRYQCLHIFEDAFVETMVKKEGSKLCEAVKFFSSKGYYIEPLIKVVLATLFKVFNDPKKDTHTAEWEVFWGLLKVAPPHSSMEWLTESLLSLYMHPEYEVNIAKCMKFLSQRELQFDTTLPAVLKRLIAENDQILQFADRVLAGTVHQIVEPSGSGGLPNVLIVSARHPDATVRLKALQSIKEVNISSIDTRDALKSIFAERIADEDPCVVSEVFEIPAYLNLVEAGTLLKDVRRVMESSLEAGAKISALRFIVHKFLPKFPNRINDVLGFLWDWVLFYPTTWQISLEAVKLAPKVGHKVFSRLRPVDDVLVQKKDFCAINKHIVGQIVQSSDVHTVQFIKNNFTQPSSLFLRLLVLLELEKRTPMSQLDSILDCLSVHFAAKEKSKTSSSWEEFSDPTDFALNFFSGASPQFAFQVLLRVVMHLQDHNDCQLSVENISNFPYKGTAATIDSMVDHALCHWEFAEAKTLLKHTITCFLSKSPRVLYKFLANIWLRDTASTSRKYTVLKVLHCFLQSKKVVYTYNTFVQLVPSLIVPALSSTRYTRAAALDCLFLLYVKIQDLRADPPSATSNPSIFPSSYPPPKGPILKKFLFFMTVEVRKELEADPTFLHGLFACKLNVGQFSQEELDSLECFLLSHGILFGETGFSGACYELVNLVSSTVSQHKLEILHPMMKRLCEQLVLPEGTQKLLPFSSPLMTLCNVAAAAFKQLNQDTAPMLNESSELRDTVLRALKSEFTASFGDERSAPTTFTLCEVVMLQISPAFWKNIDADTQKPLLEVFCSLLMGSNKAIKSTIRELLIDSEISIGNLLPYFEACCTEDSIEEELTKSLHNLVVLVDVLIEKEPKGILAFQILSNLFKFLRCLTDEDHPLSSLSYVEYAIPQTITLMLVITKYLATEKNLDTVMSDTRVEATPAKTESLPKIKSKRKSTPSQGNSVSQELSSVFDMSLLMHVLGKCHTQHMQNQILLLLGQVASFNPALVEPHLEQVIDVLGTLAHTREDGDSSRTLLNAIEFLIPPMLIYGKGPFKLVNMITSSFDKIPEKHKMPLFTKLITSLGTDGLSSVLASFISFFVVSETPAASKYATATRSEPKKIQIPLFCHSLCFTYPVVQVAQALVQLSSLANYALTEKPSILKNYCGIPQSDTKYWQFLQLCCLTFVSNHLATEEFVEQIIKLPLVDQPKLQEQFHELLQILVELLEEKSDIDSHQAKNTGHTEVIQVSVRNVLKNLNELLSVPLFIVSISKLLRHEQSCLRDTALILLNEKLQEVEGELTQEEASAFLHKEGLLGDVVEILSSDNPYTKQTALMVLEILVRNFGSSYSQQFSDIFADVISCLCCKAEPTKPTTKKLKTNTSEPATKQDLAKEEAVESSAILCLSSFVETLGKKTLVHLKDYVPLLLNRVKTLCDVKLSTVVDSKEMYDSTVVQRIACLSALQVIVRKMSSFMSPYLVELLSISLHPELLVDSTPDVLDALFKYQDACMSSLPLRQIIPSLIKIFTDRRAHNSSKSLEALFQFVGHIVSSFSTADTKSFADTIINFSLLALDVNQLLPSITNEECLREEQEKALESLERSCIGAFMKLILKQSEANFNPVFQKINKSLHVAVEARSYQQILYYFRFITELASNLKALFVPYFSYFMEDALLLLAPTSFKTLGDEALPALTLSKPLKRSKEEVSREEKDTYARHLHVSTAACILDALALCFQHDTDHTFTNPGQIERLLAVIKVVDYAAPVGAGRIPALCGKREDYVELIDKHLSPCVSDLAVALNKDLFVKPLNYKILMGTRSPVADVRCGALQCARKVWRKMGLAMLPLLPETLPFVSEVMEDTSHDVATAAKQLTNVMQQVLGKENLSDYLS